MSPIDTVFPARIDHVRTTILFQRRKGTRRKGARGRWLQPLAGADGKLVSLANMIVLQAKRYFGAQLEGAKHRVVRVLVQPVLDQ